MACQHLVSGCDRVDLAFGLYVFIPGRIGDGLKLAGKFDDWS